ncbi:hypothetical protein ONS95_001123 [Cadophora gregata]|uniref:uncharacterized protein n=1 Tax=Cadophora gregata TaxID=51156 RepID=UPI0026DD7DD7|nr:uncharacterized protein ONS95_001123 [Cadophora gregata]KAK0129188.1 hypothetical protein ONS95_001123 [Cadophora gregata]
MTSLIENQGVAPHLLSPVRNQISVSNPISQISQPQKPRDISADFNYYKDPPGGGPPEPTYVERPQTYDRVPLIKRLTVHDVRGREEQYTLDTTGFEFYKHVSVEKDFVDDEQIKSIYYPETEELLKKATGASKIYIFDHTVRRQQLDARTKPAPEPASQQSTEGPITVPVPSSLRGPVQRVHIDQSYAASTDRVTYHLPDEAETLLKGRFQIINVWRPIKTILKDPLSVAAANSVLDEELVPIKLIYPHREGETLAVRPAKEGRTDGGHQWHYLFQQTPGEVTLIKCFDSKTDGRARRVPHSAFVDEEFVGEEPRESIEVRALVFHPDDTE